MRINRHGFLKLVGASVANALVSPGISSCAIINNSAEKLLIDKPDLSVGIDEETEIIGTEEVTRLDKLISEIRQAVYSYESLENTADVRNSIGEQVSLVLDKYMSVWLSEYRVCCNDLNNRQQDIDNGIKRIDIYLCEQVPEHCINIECKVVTRGDSFEEHLALGNIDDIVEDVVQ